MAEKTTNGAAEIRQSSQGKTAAMQGESVCTSLVHCVFQLLEVNIGI